MSSPYAETAREYLDGGWAPIPLPLGEKEPPPTGYTGRSAHKQVTAEQVERWSKGKPRNVAIVLPADVVGIDVDAYAGKLGAASLAVAEANYGPLPETVRVTSRDDGVSGIRFYRVPSGRTWAGEVGPDIDVIQAGHRYAVVAPSVHPSGSAYRWLFADGSVRLSVPRTDELRPLPGPWVAALASGGAEAVSVALDPLTVADARGWLSTFVGGQPCEPVADARDTAVRNLAANRHDTMTAAVWRLTSLGAEGHRGVRYALRTVREAFADALGGERDGGAEFARALLSAARKLDGQTAEPCRCSTMADTHPDRSNRFRIGRAALEFESDDQPAIWGPPETPLWAAGESLMLVGPPSVGKSTLAQQLVLGRIGLRSDVLGYPVTDDGGRVLYIAADRPRQIARGFRRMVDMDAPQLERLVMWRGPLPYPVSSEAHRGWLADRATEYEATTIVIDSVKDVLTSLSDEIGAGGYNGARQESVARGVEWIEIHHNRKSSNDNRAPRQLDDVYGNRALTAGAGSVVSLWGKSGDQEIALSQLKPLGDRHPPLSLVLDGHTGGIGIADTPTDAAMPIDGALLLAGDAGLTAREAAREIHGERYTTQELERTRKQLEREAARGHLRTEKEGRTARFFML